MFQKFCRKKWNHINCPQKHMPRLRWVLLIFSWKHSPVNLTSCLTCHPLTNGYKLEADCILTLCQFGLKTIVCTIKKSTHPSCNPAYKNSRFMLFPKTCAAVMMCATVVWPLVWTLTLTVRGVNCILKNSYQQAFFMYFKAFSVWYIWYVLKENTDKVNGLQWY